MPAKTKTKAKKNLTTKVKAKNSHPTIARSKASPPKKAAKKNTSGKSLPVKSKRLARTSVSTDSKKSLREIGKPAKKSPTKLETKTSVKSSRKTPVRSNKRRMGIRDRLGQLTYHRARMLMDKEDGAARLRRGARFEINIQRDVRLTKDVFRVHVPNPDSVSGFFEVTATENLSRDGGLEIKCSACNHNCDHIAAVLGLVLEEKLLLGLSAPPDPHEAIENLTEAELLHRALADRQERAEREPMNIKSSDASTPWTDYSITSEQSGKTWRVSLRGEESGQSYCSCPDFRTNHLGTCKHILAVQNRIKKRFRKKDLAKRYARSNFSVRLIYGPSLGLQFNTPESLDEDAAKVVGNFGRQSTVNVEEVVGRIAQLERMGFSVHIYPDAEEFIDQRFQQSRLEKLAESIRRNPAEHSLRKSLLKAELLPYQMDGIAFAVGAGRSILADDMGLGKTIQGIGVAELLAQQVDIRRVLVVCPASVKSQWRSEIVRFSRRSAQIVLGNGAERVEQYNGDTFFTICNYEQILRDHPTIERIDWDLIILDEGQRIKNWESKTSQMIKSLRSKYALVLSGTPLENRLEELYTIAGFVDAARLGPAYRFFHRHRMVDERGKVVGYRNLDQLRQTLKPILLRRTRKEVMQQLPQRTTEIVRVTPTQEQWGMSDEFCKQAAQIAAKKYLTEMDLIRIQKALMCARMACDSTFLVTKEEPGFSSKLERLDELLQQLSEDPERKIILFSEWTTMLNLVEPLLKKNKLPFVRMDGKVPQKKRQELIHQFQNNTQCRAIILSNAGATGLNLQAANTVINIDLPWNPAVLEQRIARAHRMGQKNPVDVYLMVTENTIEERMLDVLSAKHDLAMAALDVNSKVTLVELSSGIEELKKRLEKLIGNKPAAPLDASQQFQTTLTQKTSVPPDETDAERLTQRRAKVASAGGELLGAALNLVGELVASSEQPNPEFVQQIERGLTDCTEPSTDGKLSLRLDLPDQLTLKRLASTLASLLVSATAHDG